MITHFPIWPEWKTVRILGSGSFGSVYEIERDIMGETEKAALKVISIPQNANDIDTLYNEGFDAETITAAFQDHLKSLLEEYRLMRKLNGCTNIVSCDDVRYIQHDDGIGWDIYIKMELLTPLMRALPNRITDADVIKIGMDLGSALSQCAKHNIIHRDIKPQNIFVSDNGDYKLGDFGIAKTVEKTTSGTKTGTYKYMAPEVYNNQPYGTSADIYSLGIVLYWLLNERRLPFLPLPPAKLTVDMDEDARLRRMRGETIPAPKNGSKELKKLVLKACANHPKDRFRSADELLDALKNIGKRKHTHSINWVKWGTLSAVAAAAILIPFLFLKQKSAVPDLERIAVPETTSETIPETEPETAVYDDLPDETESTETDQTNAVEEQVYPTVSTQSILYVESSPSLAEYGMVHNPERTIDDDLTTAWNEGADGPGEGCFIAYHLDDTYLIHGIVIFSGFQKSEWLFNLNTRPRDIVLIFSDGSSESFTLADIMGPQTIVLPEPHVSDSITLIANSVYPGTDSEDMCITEIDLF